MVLRITGDEVVSDAMEHRAWRVGKTWRVSWVAGHEFSKNEAITAMTIVEYLAEGAPVENVMVHVRAWLDELGLSEQDLPKAGGRG